MEKEKTLSGTTGTSNTLHSFLAMIPRGLEHEVSAMVKDKIPGVELSIVGQGDTFSHDIGLQTRKALIAHQQRKQKDWNSWFARPIGSVELSRALHVQGHWRAQCG
jgi:hypothetical protein